MVVKLAFFKRFRNQNKKKRYENPAVNQAIEEINKRKEQEAAGDNVTADARNSDAQSESSGRRGSGFSPVLSFDPTGAAGDLVYKPQPVQSNTSRSAQFDREMENLAGIYGVDQGEVRRLRL